MSYIIRIASILVLSVAVSTAFSMGRPPKPTPTPAPGSAVSRPFEGRSYTVWRPSTWVQGKTYPIVVALHGAGGADINGVSAIGTRSSEGYIAVLPFNTQGRRWNDGQEANDDGVDDVAWILGIIADVQEKDGGDPDRAFVAGFSNGSVLTQRLACDAGDKFLAFAPVSGLKPRDYECATSDQSPIAFFHGNADTSMPWVGGSLDGDKPVLSATASFQFWAEKNGCTGETVEQLPDKVPGDGTTVKKHVFASCDEETVQYEIVNGGHVWPGPPPPRNARGGDSQDIDATTEILAFFRAHGL